MITPNKEVQKWSDRGPPKRNNHLLKQMHSSCGWLTSEMPVKKWVVLW